MLRFLSLLFSGPAERPDGLDNELTLTELYSGTYCMEACRSINGISLIGAPFT